MSINSQNINYKEMYEKTNKYTTTEENLRHLIYGYHNYLDIIVPFTRFTSTTSNDNLIYKKISNFAKEITNFANLYCKEREKILLDNDYLIIENMIVAFVHFLGTNCNHSDYTFRSLIKLLKTFENYDETEDENLKSCIFYIMYEDASEQIIPAEFESAYDYIFSEGVYSAKHYHYLSKILIQSISMYLYHNSLDFTSDENLFSLANDIINETIDRLREIQFNRNYALYSLSKNKEYSPRRSCHDNSEE